MTKQKQCMKKYVRTCRRISLPLIYVAACCVLTLEVSCFDLRQDRQVRRGKIRRTSWLTSSAISDSFEDGFKTTVRDLPPMDTYSCSYPRYNVDFTSMKNAEKLFLWPWQRLLAKQQLEHNCKNLIWVDRNTSNITSTAVEGVSVMALLWRLGSDAVSKSLLMDSASDSSAFIVAFPELENSRVVRGWVDLMKWLLSFCKIDDDFIKVAYSEEIFKIPTVTLTLNEVCVQNFKLDENEILPSHETVECRTKAWVQRVLVNMNICPFTKSVKLSGQGLAEVRIPVGRIAYHTSYATPSNADTVDRACFPGLCQLQADVWEAIDDMLRAGPDAKNGGISSILLSAPAFDNHFTLWSGSVFCLLESGVIAASATDRVGVVCFHPAYLTPDGSTFPGFGHMHSVPRLLNWMNDFLKTQNEQYKSDNLESTSWNVRLAAAGGAWQRRTPHATVNVLRANQLAAAERLRSTSSLYVKNMLRLQQVGWVELHEQLENERQLEP